MLNVSLPPPDLPSACPTPCPDVALSSLTRTLLPKSSWKPCLLSPSPLRPPQCRAARGTHHVATPTPALNPPPAKKPIQIPLRGITEPHFPAWLTSSLSALPSCFVPEPSGTSLLAPGSCLERSLCQECHPHPSISYPLNPFS